MRVLTGTSGFAFKEWKGNFYPEDLKDDAMLGHYAGRFPTVEINNTFYRLPKEKVLVSWAEQVPADFTFAIKASQRITHHARLKPEAKDLVDYLLRTTSVLGDRLGPILFQLPPNLKKDAERLKRFLGELPKGKRFTIEFRHESWLDDEVIGALRDHDIAMCLSEQPESSCETISTASWGYLRLHRLDYDEAALTQWAKRVKSQKWDDVYVYFKHDEGAGSGPPAVDAFTRAVAAGSTA